MGTLPSWLAFLLVLLAVSPAALTIRMTARRARKRRVLPAEGAEQTRPLDMSPETPLEMSIEAPEHLRDKLLVARSLLAAADALLLRVMIAGRAEAAPAADRGADVQRLWTRAQHEVEQARALGAEALSGMGDVPLVQSMLRAFDPPELVLDVSAPEQATIGVAADTDVRETRARTRALRLAIEQLLRALDAP